MINFSNSMRYLTGLFGIKGIAALTLSLASINTAHADLIKYSFTSSNHSQVDVDPGVKYISPLSGISFMVSGGIDRKLRITVTENGSQNPAFRNESDRVLGATDVITYAGKTYYAEEFTSPKLPDGNYTVTTEILSSTGGIVRKDNTPLVIDTKGPTTGTFSPTPYTWGNPVLSGEVWKLGVAAIDALTYSSFILSGFSDESGISNVTARVYRESGQLFKAHNVLFSEQDKKASIEYRHNFFPNSDLDEVFSIEFLVTDKAGNISVTNRQKVMFDNIGNSPSEPFAVYDPDVTTSLAPGLKGFVPYTPGLAVKTNPIRLAWRIPKNNWHTYRLGGLHFTNSFGENKIAHVDENFVYLVASLPYRSEDVNYIRFSNFGEWGSQGTIKYDLVLHDAAPKTPVIKGVEYYFSDIGWSSYTYRVVTPQQLPIAVTKVRYTVESRPFPQIATHMGTCTIPAGQTQCEISVNKRLEKGTTGYLHDQAVLTSSDGALRAIGQWANVWWNDLHYPLITHSYNQDKMLLTLNVRQPMQGMHLNMLFHKEAWIESNGLKLSSSKKLTSSSGENFEYEFDLKTLPEGSYDLIGAASENLGAISKVSLFSFYSDRTKPVITVNTGGLESIDSLDRITFTISDNRDPAPKITSIILSGGPSNDSIALSYRKIGATTYGLEYPILFPSLTAGEVYRLTVTAEDLHKNSSSTSALFSYSPSMAGIIGHHNGVVNIPSADKEFKRNDGSRIINSEQLKLADGTPVAGIYDLLATLRSDAVSPLKIAGVLVNPGSTVMLGQLNFTQTQGRISLPVIPLNPGAAGSNGVIISTSAPNSPVVYANINTWMPELDLTINSTNPVQSMTDLEVKLKAKENSMCTLTTSVDLAKDADPILGPLCLLEWTDVPNGLNEKEMAGEPLPITKLTGRALETGNQKVGYSIYVYNMGTDKVLLDTGEQVLYVEPANGSSTFSHSLDGKFAVRTTETTAITIEQKSGPACTITGDEELAKNSGLQGGQLTCLIEITNKPLELDLTSATPIEIKGIFSKAGKYPLHWTASVFNYLGEKIILERTESSIDVVHPNASTMLSFSINESAEAEITPIETMSNAWGIKSYEVISNPSNGSATASLSGFVYKPNSGYIGKDSFKYKVLDESGMEAIGNADINVEKHNYPPTYTSVNIYALEGTVSNLFTPIIHDLNLWDSHSLEVTKKPKKGALRVVDDAFEYTPYYGQLGDDDFNYIAIDQEGFSIEGTGTVTIQPFNHAPIKITPPEAMMLSGIGGVVQLHVSDQNLSDTHELLVIQQPSHGIVTIDGKRMTYKTDGSDSDFVIVRAIDQHGLYVDQKIILKLQDRIINNNIIRTIAPISKAR